MARFAIGVLVFVAISVEVARYLTTESRERNAVLHLLHAQARGAALALTVIPGAVTGLARAADVPSGGSLYESGPSGRYLIDGTWLLRLDPGNRGIAAKWERNTSTAGWTDIQVPYSWNVSDDTAK